MGRTYVIVGNGPAGATAAETIRLHDAAATITVVGNERVPFYSRPGLAYLLTGAVPEKQLYSRPDQSYERAGITRIVGQVELVAAADRQVALTDGRILPYDRLLLAVGARAVRPDIPGIELQGVVTLDNLDDARQILHLARRARRACVVGGGITAVELAEGLVARGIETHYLMRGERYWSGVLDPDESGIVEGRLTQHGIRCHHGVELARVVGRDGRVEAVETRDGSTFPCEILAVAIGVQPRLELAHGLGLATGRGIWTDERLQTADPDIFAAGDVAEVMDPESGRRGIDSLWSVAIEQGRAAGENMAGLDRPYRRTAPVNVTMIGGVTTTIIGALGGGRRDGDLVTIARGDSLAWREHPDGFAVVSASGGDHVRLVLGEDRIVGALVMGDQALSRQLQVLVRERADIRAVRDRLAAPGAAIRPVLAELLDGTASGGPR